MTLSRFYNSFSEDSVEAHQRQLALMQIHWFTENAEFDPKTGDALPQSLSSFLAKLAFPRQSGKIQDRLFRITEHARPSIEHLIRTIIKSPRREQALLPVHAVRELDANSFIKLCNRPGRNFREKLAGKPYLQAVRRYQSVNLPENRLLKAFLTHLSELLELRRDLLGEEEDDLLPRIRLWLLSREAQGIARWDNLPPNNTLLSHRDYRRIWDAWRWLQRLDEDLAHDLQKLEERAKTLRKWTEYGQVYTAGKHCFPDMPVFFNYKNFAIEPWVSNFVTVKLEREFPRLKVLDESLDPVCIDLTAACPRYATSREDPRFLRESLLWQQWTDDHKSVDIELFYSDAAYLHEDATTITSTDLFLARNKIKYSLLDRAARAFTTKLRAIFKNDNLSWLVPDFISDFQLEILRRNLNAQFPGAEPLPRSVAAIFEQVDFAKVNSDGFPVVVVDRICGVTSVTKLIARFDQELKDRLPETRGYYWERCPSVILSDSLFENYSQDHRQGYELATLDSNGEWHAAADAQQAQYVNPQILKRDSRVGRFVFCVNLSTSPVAGGSRLQAMQRRAKEIPLWRDQIPELSIKVIKDGRYQRFYLVKRGTTIKPIRGKPVPIPVAENFTLTAGKSSYPFPLFQGENANELGFSARLDSPAFPLKENSECELQLSFEYGADEPYKLLFVPLDNSFSPIRVEWHPNEEKNPSDAPAPGYPTPLSWSDLRRVPKPKTHETSDLIEWILTASTQLDRDLFYRPKVRVTGTLVSDWRKDRNGKYFAFARSSDANQEVFIHESTFLTEYCYDKFIRGDDVSFELQEKDGRFSSWKVASPDFIEEACLRQLDDHRVNELICKIRRKLYFPFIQVWSDGRSIEDQQCPDSFVRDASSVIGYLTSLASLSEMPPSMKREIFFLLSTLHKDTSDECISWIFDQVETGQIRDPRAVGFALGDVSQEWQLYIFESLIADPQEFAIRVFAYAIWRDERFVKRFTLRELIRLVASLSRQIENIGSPSLPENGVDPEWAKRGWARGTAEPLELLLGLLRTRISEDPEIKILLQPHQKITKQLAEQVDRIDEIIAKSNITLFSRVQIDVQKPEGDYTPDLLYALRLYLTGDDGASAIHITSVSDSYDE